jgi:hypothetical protein
LLQEVERGGEQDDIVRRAHYPHVSYAFGSYVFHVIAVKSIMTGQFSAGKVDFL